MDTLFLFFPLLVTDYFFMITITMGYWLALNPSLFISLGFLIPFSTLLNCFLKQIFQFPRPDAHFHQIAVLDPFGFPSGDAQVATVFWLMLFFNTRHLSRYLYLLIIIGVSFSRVYLGVHSFYDVLAGTLIGVATVFFWRYQIKNGNDLLDLLKHWMLFTIPMFLYLFFELQFDMAPMISKAAGFLMSLAVILHTQGSKICDIHIKLSHAAIYLTVTLCLFVLLSQFKTHPFLHHFSNVLRFSFVVGMIFFAVPKIDSIIRSKNSQKHLFDT